MRDILQIIGTLCNLASIDKRHINLQFLLLFTVAATEAFFIFQLIAFLTLFDSSQDVANVDGSNSLLILSKIFDFFKLKLSFQTIALTICLTMVLRETLSAFRQIHLQKTMAKIERGVKENILKIALKASFLQMSSLGNGPFSELTNVCSREAPKVIQSILQLTSISVTVGAYFFVLVVSSPYVAISGLALGCLSLLCLNHTVEVTRRHATKIVDERTELAQNFNNLYYQLRELKLGSHSKSIVSGINRQLNTLIFHTVKSQTVGVKIRSGLTIILVFLSINGAAHFRDSGVLDLATLTSILTMVMRLLPLVLNFTRIRQGYAANLPFLKKLESFEEKYKKLEESDVGETDFPKTFNVLTFDSVSFSYPSSNKKALKKINVRLVNGNEYVLSGASGAGKSTLIDLIPGLIQPSSGAIYFDDIDYKNLKLSSLRNAISYTPQIPIIFDETLFYNVTLSDKECCKQKFFKLMKALNLYEFMLALPDQEQTILGNRGVKLSGGQAQRLAIARAIYREASIYIFDEPSSALDKENSKSVAKALLDLNTTNTAIIIIITHDTHFSSFFSKILKLKDGCLSYKGD